MKPRKEINVAIQRRQDALVSAYNNAMMYAPTPERAAAIRERAERLKWAAGRLIAACRAVERREKVKRLTEEWKDLKPGDKVMYHENECEVVKRGKGLIVTLQRPIPEAHKYQKDEPGFYTYQTDLSRLKPINKAA